jgi:hypothetical protein
MLIEEGSLSASFLNQQGNADNSSSYNYRCNYFNYIMLTGMKGGNRQNSTSNNQQTTSLIQ